MRFSLVIAVAGALYGHQVFGKCVHETALTGAELEEIASGGRYTAHVAFGDRFFPAEGVAIAAESTYRVQLFEKTTVRDEANLPYYDYQQMLTYLATMGATIESRGYSIEEIGESLEGRTLFGIYPRSISSQKKTIVMTGRQHGDEGTANWIIEGFLNRTFLEAPDAWFDEYQLILYPMINPDGVEAVRRYNANNRDLNRVWSNNARNDPDEVGIVHTHMRNLLAMAGNRAVIALDMHGSFTEDFIFRVDRDYIDRDFYQLQGEFISGLGDRDPWQSGNFRVSNGNPGMFRIVYVTHYGFNALTHETPREIDANNPRRRSLATLKDQGVAIFDTILEY